MSFKLGKSLFVDKISENWTLVRFIDGTHRKTQKESERERAIERASKKEGGKQKEDHNTFDA